MLTREYSVVLATLALFFIASFPAMAASPAEPFGVLNGQEAPTPVPQRISFAPGATSAETKGTLAPNDMKRFVINAMGGQTMIVKLTPGDPQNPEAILIIWGKDGTVLISDHVGATAWSGPLPSTQDYYIDVRSVVQTTLDFVLTVTIPPFPTPSPTPVPQRISFAPGATSAQEQGTLAPGDMKRYVIKAMKGQTMIVKVTPGDVYHPQAVLIIWGEDGTVLMSDHAGATAWSGPLPSTQDYYIDVRSVVQSTVDFTLDVSIPPPSK
jgi:hypothetical protein